MKGFLGTIRQHTQVVRDALDMQTLRDGQGIFAQNEVGAAPATGMIRLKARTCASYRAANGVFYELLGDKKNIFVSDHIKDVLGRVLECTRPCTPGYNMRYQTPSYFIVLYGMTTWWGMRFGRYKLVEAQRR